MMFSFYRVGRSPALLAAVAFAVACASDASNSASKSVETTGPSITNSSSTTASVVVALDSATLAPTHTARVHAYALNSKGDTLKDKTPTVSSTNPSVADVVSGVVAAYSPGSAMIQGEVDGVWGRAQLTVAAEAAVPAPATHLALVSQPGGAMMGQNLAMQPVVQVRDAADGVVSTSTAPVTAVLAPGTGTLLGTTTVNAVNGVASFTDLRVAGAGTYTLTFSSAPLLPATSIAFTITQQAPPPAVSLAVQRQPAGATTGSSMQTQPIVRILDGTGALVVTSSAAVTATRTSGTGVLMGTTTVNAVGGIASFTDLRLDGSGFNMLTFTIDNPALSVMSAAFSVAVGPPAQLVMRTQPSGANSGVVWPTQPVVEIRDIANQLTASSASVTAAVASGTGTLTGPTTVTAVNGVATFAQLAITGNGNVSLKFTSPALTAATSSQFAIGQAAPPPPPPPPPAPQAQPASLAMQTQPAGATTGSKLTTQPVVRILDAGGAVLPNSVLPVTVTRTTGAGVLTGTTTINAVAGVATFTDLRLDGSGNNVLTFSIANPALSVASAAITVAVGPAAQLAMRTQPAGGTSGVALTTQPVVEIRDVANQLTASGIAVTAVVASGTGTLSGPITVNAVNGVASFAGLIITGAGNSSLKFTTAAPALNVVSNVFAVAAGVGVGGGGTSVTSLSRDGGSSAGGAVITITGTGFGATDMVQFDGKNATRVVFVNATTLQATVPAGTATNMANPTAVNVSVIHNGVAATLPSSFTYWPAPQNILAAADFEDGTLGSFTTVVPKNNIVVNTKSHTGTHSLHSFALGPSQNDQISWARTQDDIVGGPGRWHRWYLLIPAATLAATANSGQIKLFLSRTGVTNGFVTLGEGWEFNSNDNELASRVDYQTLIIHTGPVITADVWHEVQVYEYRDPVAHLGTARVWFDGKLVAVRTLEFLGDDDPTVVRAAVFGAVYTQNASSYPLDVYVDDIKIGNGYIDPTP